MGITPPDGSGAPGAPGGAPVPIPVGG